MKLLKKDIVVYLSDGKELATPNVFRAVNSIQEDLISENEKAVADWVFRNNKHAGATTDILSSAIGMMMQKRMQNFGRNWSITEIVN